jgi:histidine ammonia-lyase
MIPQYVAASLVSQNKQYCTPASVDSITSCNGQEDHVSMGANAAIKAHKVLENVKTILAIELLTVNQAMGLRNAQTSAILQQVLDLYRTVLPTPYITQDNAQVMHEVIELTKHFLHSEDSPVSLSFSA